MSSCNIALHQLEFGPTTSFTAMLNRGCMRITLIG